MFGLDYVSGPSIAAMKAANVSFVCRYLSQVNDLSRIKLLTLAEAHVLSQAGIAIVSNYEWYAARPLGGFQSGVIDASLARDQHAACGGPDTAPIYFSVDFNATSFQMPAIADYFRGIASVITIKRTRGYGSYGVVKSLLDAGLISGAWQTYAWSNSLWEPRAAIRQTLNSQTLDNHSVDYDESMVEDFGQWRIPMPHVPTGWSDNGTELIAPNGVKVVLGFREHVLNSVWNPENVPQETEFYPAQVELHNLQLGPGSVQIFRDNLLWYTSAHGVVQEPYLGLEIAAAYAKIAQLQSQQVTISPDIATQITAIDAALQKIKADLTP